MMLTSLVVATALDTARATILAYAGPDQILPLASILGAIIGFLLIVWQRVVAMAYRVWKFTMRKVRGTAE
jgi:hypothetical protein